MDKQNGAMIFETAELACLMQVRSVRAAAHLGLNGLADFSEQQLQKARDSLQAAGLLSQNGQITSQNLPVFDGLFFPERSLVAVCDLPDQGQQELTFLNRQGTTVLYTRLDDESHRLEIFPQMEQVVALLKQAFPLEELPAGERFAIPAALLETLPNLVASGDLTGAKQALEILPCDPHEKDFLLQAVQNRKISGSIAVLDLQDGEAVDGFSLAILADDQSAWLFHQPSPDGKFLIAQRNGALFSRMLDIFSQRLTGGTMLNEPLDKNKIASFSLTAEEFAFCFVCNDRNDIALNLINTHFPGAEDIQAQLDRHMLQAGDSLAARGWSNINQDAGPKLAQKLQSAISAIVGYDYVLQVNIVRPNLAANATVHVIKNRLFTSVLRPSQEVYFLEHGDISTLPAYLSKLFLDFGQASVQIKVLEEKIPYPQLADALGKNDGVLSAQILSQAGLNTATAALLAQDMLEAAYQGTLVRINVDSHASQEMIDGTSKPLLLLLKGQQRSWLYHFVPAVDNAGSLILVNNRESFLEQLAKFTA